MAVICTPQCPCILVDVALVRDACFCCLCRLRRNLTKQISPLGWRGLARTLPLRIHSQMKSVSLVECFVFSSCLRWCCRMLYAGPTTTKVKQKSVLTRVCVSFLVPKHVLRSSFGPHRLQSKGSNTSAANPQPQQPEQQGQNGSKPANIKTGGGVKIGGGIKIGGVHNQLTGHPVSTAVNTSYIGVPTSKVLKFQGSADQASVHLAYGGCNAVL